MALVSTQVSVMWPAVAVLTIKMRIFPSAQRVPSYPLSCQFPSSTARHALSSSVVVDDVLCPWVSHQWGYIIHTVCVLLVLLGVLVFKNHQIPWHMAEIWQGRSWHCPGTVVHCWGKCKRVHSVWKTAWQAFTKLNMFLTYNPGMTVLGIYPKEPKPYVLTKCAPRCL